MSENIIKKFAKRFKQLNKGVIRLLIVLWLLIMLIGLALVTSSNFKTQEVGMMLVVLFVFYWFIIRIGLWIKDGFDENVKPID